MNRLTAKRMHASTSLAYWMENPNWDSGDDRLFNLERRAMQALPFSLYKLQKRAFYDPDKVLSVSGETVVVANGSGKVDKFMFRYPGKMSLPVFEHHVQLEIGTVTRCLAGIALATEVGIKPAYIFRSPRTHVDAVAQTQQRLDLDIHVPLDLAEVRKAPVQSRDRTARDLESLLTGAHALIAEYGSYPDIANNSGNLRRSTIDGSVTLLDVMPFYADGNRLIDDKSPDSAPHVLTGLHTSIQGYHDFVGQYGG